MSKPLGKTGLKASASVFQPSTAAPSASATSPIASSKLTPTAANFVPGSINVNAPVFTPLSPNGSTPVFSPSKQQSTFSAAAPVFNPYASTPAEEVLEPEEHVVNPYAVENPYTEQSAYGADNPYAIPDEVAAGNMEGYYADHGDESLGMGGVGMGLGVPLDGAEYGVDHVTGPPWFPIGSAPIVVGQRPASISATAFDAVHEMVWNGTSDGRLVSVSVPSLHMETSFPAHDTPIADIFPTMDGLLSVSSNSVAFHTRGGAVMTRFRSPVLHDVCASTLSSRGQEIILGGRLDRMLVYDLVSGEIKQQVQCDSKITALCASRLLCVGTETGVLQFRDPRSFSVLSSAVAHAGGNVTCIDAKDDLIITCGSTRRPGAYQRFAPDTFVQVYDIRTMRPLSPLCIPGAICAKFLPTIDAKIVVADSQGGFSILEVENSSPMDAESYSYTPMGIMAQVSSIAVAPTGALMAFGDMYGTSHVFTDDEHGVINPYSIPFESGDAWSNPAPFEMNEFTPPSVLYSKELEQTEESYKLSHWNDDTTFRPPKPTPPVDTTLIEGLKWNDFIGYARCPKVGFIRNNPDTHRKFATARKVTHKGRNKTISAHHSGNLLHSPFVKIKKMKKEYAKVKIKIPRFGLYSFDFSSYNRTHFTGLNNVLPNSYSNALIQSLYFCPQIRSYMMNHLCHKESCITCELGFLFHMMDHCGGQTIEARNFLRVMRQIPEVAALGLLDSVNIENPELVLANRIQDFDRFLLEHLNKESLFGAVKGAEEEKSMIGKLFGIQIRNESQCLGGNHTSVKHITNFSVKLVYPTTRTFMTFPKLLMKSMSQESTRRIWCEKCNDYQATKNVRRVAKLPTILTVTCNISNITELDMWRTSNSVMAKAPKLTGQSPSPDNKWLPLYLRIQLDPKTRQPKVSHYHGAVKDNEAASLARSLFGAEEKTSSASPSTGAKKEPSDGASGGGKNNTTNQKERTTSNRSNVSDGQTEAELTDEEVNGVVYRLTCVISHILDPPEKDSMLSTVNGEHLVCHSFVPPEYGTESDHPNRWFAFNDFVISPSSPDEAVRFDYVWKQACVLRYVRVDDKEVVPPPVYENPVTNQMLYMYNESLANRRMRPNQRFVRTFDPLKPTEKIDHGTRVAIDCEFVAVQKEETVLNAKGHRIVVRPSRLTLARVSCVRGDGPYKYRPFIDDYILTSEPVVDYLTQFSGIRPGDLERNSSTHHLTTLKSAYVRLRALTDAGVVFVGHGLKKDFQMINIVVPPHQIIDTVDLFYKPGNRRLGLRFLAMHLLKENIQEDTHDSIEDAHTALRLADKYEELKENGTLFEVIDHLYAVGHQSGFKV